MMTLAAQFSSPWEKLLQRPDSHGHLVQIYQSGDPALAENVGRYLSAGMERDDGLLVIATAENRQAIQRELERLGLEVEPAVRAHQLVFLDAHETLSRFMRAGQPNWTLFEDVVGDAMSQVHPAGDDAGLRAYGEMVGILWKARQFSAAIRLEQFWNRLLGQSSFSLYCGYAIDVFGKDFQISSLDAILCTHTHVVPANNDNLETAINRAMKEILGPDAAHLKLLIKANFRPSWAVMPMGEAMALWLRSHLPRQADLILGRAWHLYQALQSPSVVSL
jgi:hypothetical protein